MKSISDVLVIIFLTKLYWDMNTRMLFKIDIHSNFFRKKVEK